MRLAIAGDVAGQPLVAALTAHFAGGDVEALNLSEPADGGAELYAELADWVASAVLADA